MLQSPSIKLYFLFLSYILQIINKINLEMQSEQPRMHIFLPRLKYLFNTISRNFISKNILDSTPISSINLQNYNLPDKELYCGAEVELYCQNISDQTIIKAFKFNVRNFYIKFCESLRSKIDFDNEVLQLLTKFSPEHVLSGTTNSILNLLLNMFPDSELEKAEIINTEYRALSDYEDLKKLKNLNICDFWNEVGQIKNELGAHIFSNIFRIVQGVLSLPHSSANVERIFSFQNIIKTKCRNRLAVSTCDALIQTKDLLKSNNTECFNYKIPSSIFSKKIIEVEDDALLE